MAPSQTSAALAAAIRGNIEFDLIICGEGSSDLYTQQVGPVLAEKLGIPCATYVNKLTYVEAENRIVAERKLDEGIEAVSIPLPALITVLPDINTPRIPSLKQVLGAAKKPVENITLDKLGEDSRCMSADNRRSGSDHGAAALEIRRRAGGDRFADKRSFERWRDCLRRIHRWPEFGFLQKRVNILWNCSMRVSILPGDLGTKLVAFAHEQ